MSAHTGKPTHEQAVRIVLASLERSAARYQRHIVPLISLSMDFYVRMFVRVYTRPEEAKRSMLYSFPFGVGSGEPLRRLEHSLTTHHPLTPQEAVARLPVLWLRRAPLPAAGQVRRQGRLPAIPGRQRPARKPKL